MQPMAIVYRPRSETHADAHKLSSLDEQELPNTDKYISCTCDTRLKLEATEEQLRVMADVIIKSLDNTIGGGLGGGSSRLWSTSMLFVFFTTHPTRNDHAAKL